MRRDRGIVCLITDRAQLGAPSDLAAAGRTLATLAREAVDAGVDIIQVRERDLDAAPLVDIAGAIVEIARGSGTDVVVNDRLDVAIACAANGVHLRADSFSSAASRAMTPPGFLIGRSVHGASEAREHGSTVDYVIAGTVFATPSKPLGSRLLLGPGLEEIVEAVRVPVLAIGGVTMDRVGEVAAAGAAGIAGIRLFLHHGAPMRTIVQAIRERFDRVRAAS
jgi:thiamine-phosphate pyrophosphorylase